MAFFSDFLSVTETAEWVSSCAPRRAARTTIESWCVRGLRGRTLPSTVFGGRRFIRPLDICRFLGWPLELAATAPVPGATKAAAASSSPVTASSGPEPAAR